MKQTLLKGELFEVVLDFKIALASVMGKLGKRKDRAPGAYGVYCEMLTVDLSLTERVILSLWEACSRLGMIPWLFSFELESLSSRVVSALTILATEKLDC